ncbi:PhzF family phenazine biosynthesis protein [Fusibacter paucivorans]|uniref:PhzF family phenazine biosynthesis protein n=1 Tax=Fusibacter paucivorans TaxID=76009 RepID=A0ABS5PJU0_9FIRM|nr:PhzF family phenazine biosynthesis protein [Fusibacter paucivorans]MBS7525258.1 PhzF family phenazine biosynthesis protein [Fusibacter paucivorans]
MIPLNFKKIDAFTDGSSSGNPAGYVFLEESQILSDSEMQKMGTELKGFVNEVGFVTPYADGFKLKYYSSECEVAFCGHATIAIMYDLLASNPSLHGQRVINLYINAGKLSAFNHLDTLNAVYIMAPEPQYLETSVTAASISDALGINISALDNRYPIQAINGGLKTLIVPVKTLANCLSIWPDESSLKQYCLVNDIDIILIFTEETYDEHAHFRTRVFAPKFGYLEDPATGSGNSAFGYYLYALGQHRDDLIIEQSANKTNANIVKLKTYEDEKMTRMLFGGCATTRIDGKYHLHR